MIVRRRLVRWSGLLLLAGVVVQASACARPGRPRGGPEDRIPPMVVSTWPEPFDTIEATRDPVRITFNERISERPTTGRLDDAVIVSPSTGATRVEHSRMGLEISVVGGFQEGLVYRVRVLPTLKDLFNNPMADPFELVFSTGGELGGHVLAGVVTDRITGEPLEGVRVDAQAVNPEEEEPGPAYTARTDTAGIYVIRFVPSGPYTLTAYQDVNRNREVDFRELQGSTSLQLGLLPPRLDTIVSRLALLRPDTSAAQLIRVEAVDSTTLRVGFDDYLPPETSLQGIQILVQADGEEPLPVSQILWQRELDSLRAARDSIRRADSLQARRDSLQGVADSLQSVLRVLQAGADTVAADSVARALDALLTRLGPPEPVAPPGRPQPGRPPVQERRPPPILPETEIFVLLGAPLTPGVPHQVRVTGVVNVNGVPGGGGEATVEWEPPPTPPGRRGGGSGPMGSGDPGRSGPSRVPIPRR